jgi:hypothetical protein
MKILSHHTGRALQFINTDEYLPMKGTYVPEAIKALIERYEFALPPPKFVPWVEVIGKGLRFETGRFKVGKSTENIQDLVIYNDGLLVTAYSTDIAESFLTDFFTWGEAALGFRVLESSFRKRIFLSEMVVGFDQLADSALRDFERLSKLFQDALQLTYKIAFPPIHLIAFKCDFGSSQAPPDYQMLSPLSFERRLNHSLEENVFLCAAPLRTNDHIALLEQFESFLAG